MGEPFDEDSCRSKHLTAFPFDKTGKFIYNIKDEIFAVTRHKNIYLKERTMDGIINLYKPKGYTSHDAVARIKRFCSTRRVGHAGTLDPMAQGVLPILVGRAAAAQEYLMNHDKCYLAGMRFGTVTDTGDMTGNIISQKDVDVPRAELERVSAGFVGKIMQTPPMYSAIKIGGKKLYELAREGVEVERKARQIEIYSIDIVKQCSPCDFLVKVSCSKGTYIRTLCEDIGNALSCGGTLFSLERLSCGEFKKEDTVTIEQLEALFEAGKTDDIEKLLVSPEKVFSDRPVIKLSAFYSGLCKNGCEIYLKKLGISPDKFENGSLVRLYDGDGNFFALGKTGDFKDGRAVKAVCRFAD